MNKGLIGASAAVVIGAGAAAGYYVYSHRTPKALDCDQVKAAIDSNLKDLPGGTKASYNGFTCEAATGKIGFSDITLTASDADGTTAKFETVTVDGAKGANISRVFDPKSYGSQQPAQGAPAQGTKDKQPLFAQLVAAKATIGKTNDPGKVTLTNLRISDLSARPLAKAPPATLAGYKDLSRADTLDLAQALSFKEIAFDNVAAKDAFSLGSFKTGPYDGANLSNFELGKFAATDPTQTSEPKTSVTFDQLALKGLDLASLFQLQLPPEGFETPQNGAKALLSLTMDELSLKNLTVTTNSEEIDQISFADFTIKKLKNMAFDTISLEGFKGHSADENFNFGVGKLAVTGFDASTVMQSLIDGADVSAFQKMKISGYEVSGISVSKDQLPAITLDSLTAKAGPYVDDVPTSGTVTLSKLVIPAGIVDNAEDRKIFDQLGYDKLVFNMNSDYSYDPKAKAIDIKDFTIDLENGGTLSIPFALNDFDYGALQRYSLTNLESGVPPLDLLNAKLAHLKVIYTDHSLFDRVLKVAGSEEGSSPDDMKKMAISFLTTQKQDAPGPVTAAAVDGVLAFLTKPNKLTVAITPNKPIGYSDLEGVGDDPEAVAKALNLTVKAE